MSSSHQEAGVASPATRLYSVDHFNTLVRTAQHLAEQMYGHVNSNVSEILRNSRSLQGLGVHDEQVLQTFMRVCDSTRQDVETMVILLDSGVSWEVAYHGINVGRSVQDIQAVFENGVRTGQEIAGGARGGLEVPKTLSSRGAEEAGKEKSVAAEHEATDGQQETEPLASSHEANEPPQASNTAPNNTTPDAPVTNPPTNTTSTSTTRPRSTEGPFPHHIKHMPPPQPLGEPLKMALDTSNRKPKLVPTPRASAPAAAGPAAFQRRNGALIIGRDADVASRANRSGERKPATPKKSPGFGEYDYGADGKPL